MIFIDLEDTVIEDWDSMIPMEENIEKIKRFVGTKNKIGVFSWAIFNDNDVKTFNNKLKGMLEDRLGAKIVEVVTMEQIKKVLGKSFGMTIEDEDFTTFINKELAFERFITQRIDCGESVDNVNMLFDDTVRNKTIIVNEVFIEFFNINK